MPFPASLTLVTVNVRADLLPDGGSAGSVRLHYDGVPLTGPTADSIVAYVDETETFAADGTATLQVPATNATGWTPQDFAYRVTLRSGSRVRRGTVQLDRATTTVNLADLIQWDGAAVAGTTYATLAQLTTVSTDLDAAEADIATLETTAATLTSGLATATSTANLASAGYVKASDHGLVGWTFDPALVQGGTVLPTAGLAHVARVRMLSAVATNIHFHFTAGGSSLTAGQCFAALYNDAGALLGAGAVTADQAANWATGGYKTCPLSVAQGVTPYAWYRVLFWFNGTTGPTISRGVNSSSAILNAGLSAPTLRYSSADTGLTTAAPANIGSQTGTATAWWVGVS
jgi:hypothetical protein